MSSTDDVGVERATGPALGGVAAALERRKGAKHRKAEDEYLALLRARRPDVRRLADLADRLGKSGGDVDADLKVLAEAKRLTDLAAGKAAAAKEHAAAMRERDVAADAIKAAQGRLDAIHQRLLDAQRRHTRSTEAEEALAALRLRRPDLLGPTRSAVPTPAPAEAGTEKPARRRIRT